MLTASTISTEGEYIEERITAAHLKAGMRYYLTVECSFEELVKALGKPKLTKEPGAWSDAEWLVMTERGLALVRTEPKNRSNRSKCYF